MIHAVKEKHNKLWEHIRGEKRRLLLIKSEKSVPRLPVQEGCAMLKVDSLVKIFNFVLIYI